MSTQMPWLSPAGTSQGRPPSGASAGTRGSGYHPGPEVDCSPYMAVEGSVTSR